MALSIVNTTSAHPAHLAFNTAPPLLNGSQPSAGPGNAGAGDPAATAVSTIDAVKPAPHLTGASPVTRDARASVRFATNPVSTGPAAASASDYAKAIAAYTRQSIVGAARPWSTDATSGDAPKGAVAAIHAAGPHVSQSIGGVGADQPNVPQAIGSNPQAAARSASGGIGANDNTAAPTADATPPATLLQAGGQAHPIAAPTAHAVMSLLKAI